MLDRPRPAYLILGLVRRGAATGYAMKQWVEQVFRFFWTVSYGQLYPELKRLEADGLLTSREEADGGRRRKVYALTAAGEAELEDWLWADVDGVFELRVEALAQLLLSYDVDQQVAILRRTARMATERREAIGAIEAPREVGRQVRDFGVRWNDLVIAWCADAEAALRADTTSA